MKEQEIKAFENKEEIKKQIFSAMKNIKIDIREMEFKNKYRYRKCSCNSFNSAGIKYYNSNIL